MPHLHVSFDLSIAGSVSQAIRKTGGNERSVGLIDDLSLGPIDFPTAESRAEWVEDATGYEFLEIVQRAEFFWREVTSRTNSVIAWVCFDDSAEYCGFLEFLWRIGETPFKVIDATGLEFIDKSHRQWAPRGLGVISADRMIEAGLIDRAKPLRADEIDNYRRLWSRLRAENAPLRVVSTSGLISAPMTYFDDWLARCATVEWRKGARIVGEAMAAIWESDAGAHVSDMWLWGRARALAMDGVLELKGDTSEMRSTMVRRRSA
jgi:hypothetical protein